MLGSPDVHFSALLGLEPRQKQSQQEVSMTASAVTFLDYDNDEYN